jgi:hypothetical protein
MVNTAGPDVQAAEEVDPMQVQVEPSVDVVETWQLGPCGLSGKREGARLVNASGVCGSMQFFASRLSREPAQADDGFIRCRLCRFGDVDRRRVTFGGWYFAGTRLDDEKPNAFCWFFRLKSCVGISGCRRERVGA